LDRNDHSRQTEQPPPKIPAYCKGQGPSGKYQEWVIHKYLNGDSAFLEHPGSLLKHIRTVPGEMGFRWAEDAAVEVG
jgi:hypothetical protein